MTAVMQPLPDQTIGQPAQLLAAPAVSPASFVSELKNPATYLTMAAYVPMFWAIFFAGNPHSEGVAISVLHFVAIICGPIATVGYALAHALKASAHESRLKEVESAIAAAATSFHQSGLGLGEIESGIDVILTAIRGVKAPIASPSPAPTIGPAKGVVVSASTGAMRPA